ncbi:MAG TPA: hypothetical protein VKX34_07030 [Aequorivita sp.]|nr:hypothetical protein [Aequorivita sp.]
MTWRGVWEGIASLFENTLLLPFDSIRSLELESWWLANLASWVFLIIGCVAFIYWLRTLANFNESTECTYTFNENPNS